MAIILIISTLINLQAQITIFLVLKIIYFGVLGGIIMGGVQTIFSVTGLWTYKSNEVVWSVFQLPACGKLEPKGTAHNGQSSFL